MAQLSAPMRQELVSLGFEELTTPSEVDAALADKEGTVLVFVNSICGCAGGIARPGVGEALRHSRRPERLTTVFAGQDKEATEQARTYFVGYPPSSPSIALLKDGQVVHMLERHQIEGRDAQAVAADLKAAFDQHCPESA